MPVQEMPLEIASPAPWGPQPGVAMLYTIGVILFILWILGFGVFHVASALIHILLIAAIIVVLWSLIAGRRTV